MTSCRDDQEIESKNECKNNNLLPYPNQLIVRPELYRTPLALEEIRISVQGSRSSKINRIPIIIRTMPSV